MRGCERTPDLVEAALGPGLGPADRSHAEGCPRCALAVAAARRFEGELRSVGTGLSPELMPPYEEIALVMDDSKRPIRAGRQLLVAATATVAALLVVGSFVGGEWLGSALGPLFRAPAGPSGSVGEAAALIGAREDGVLRTEDGVIGIRDLGDRLQLVLVRASDSGLEEWVLDTLGEREISIISCADDELARGDFLWGSKPGVVGVEGDGDSVVTDERLVLFAFDANSEARSVTLVERNGRSEFDHGRWHVQDCLVPQRADEAAARAAREAAERAQGLPPEAVTCADWGDLDSDAQLTVTRDAIFEWLMPAVRAREELPDASVEDVVAAARSSLDKGCQDPASVSVTIDEIAVLLYGR
jgi:hypothetical protein